MIEAYSNIVLDNSKAIDLSNYDNCSIFNETLFKVTVNNFEGIINGSGNLLIEPIYTKIVEHDKFIKVNKDRKYGLFFNDGTVMTYPIYDAIGEFKNGIAKIEKNKKYGYIDETGREIVIPIYNKIGEFSENIVSVCFQGKWGYINKSGDVIKKPCYDGVTNFENGVAIVRDFRKYGLINKQGEEIIPLVKYTEIKKFHDNLALFKIEEQNQTKYGYIDRIGNEVIKPIYEDAKNFHNNVAWVKLNAGWSLIDNNGNILTKEIYDNVSLHPQNLLTITKKNEKYGLIDQKGQVLIPTICDNISCISDEYILIDKFLFNIEEVHFKYIIFAQDYSEFIEIPFTNFADLNHFDNDLSQITNRNNDINIKKLIKK